MRPAGDERDTGNNDDGQGDDPGEARLNIPELAPERRQPESKDTEAGSEDAQSEPEGTRSAPEDAESGSEDAQSESEGMDSGSSNAEDGDEEGHAKDAMDVEQGQDSEGMFIVLSFVRVVQMMISLPQHVL